MSDLGQKLIWLMAVRVLVVLSLLLPYLIYLPASALPPGPEGGDSSLLAFEQLLEAFRPAPPAGEAAGPPALDPSGEVLRLLAQILRLLVVVVSLQTLLYAVLLQVLSGRPRLHACLQIAGDLLLVTLLLYKFAGVTIGLSVLYFAVIAIGTFLLRRRAGTVVALSALALYAAVTFAHQSDALREDWRERRAEWQRERAAGQPRGIEETVLRWIEPPLQPPSSSVPVGYSLLVHGVGFVMMAFFTSYLARDPTLERQLAERSQDLAQLQTLHRDVLQSISSGLVVTDLDGVVSSVNRAACEILRRSEDTMVEHPVEATGLFEGDMWQRVASRSGNGMVRSELELSQGGDTFHIGFSIAHLRDGEGAHRGYILIFQDLTEWRRLQEQVRTQDRMAALGQMAAGLAHEVGNPLAAISGSVQMLRGAIGSESADTKLLDITLKESRRLDRTVKSFLQFAKPPDRHPRRFDIAALLAEDVALLRNSEDVSEEHSVELKLEPPSAMVYADVDQIGQLFWNLARNAVRAMPDGGRLTIVGRQLDDTYRIEFQDSGHGMTEQERAELFQPFKSFFDRGLGLGMAIVYRIVQEHHGDIWVESEPGHGTTVAVELPLEATTEDGLEALDPHKIANDDPAPDEPVAATLEESPR
ncbi:MAG: ATP-binding protein [Acidobacteriota bacterium]